MHILFAYGISCDHSVVDLGILDFALQDFSFYPSGRLHDLIVNAMAETSLPTSLDELIALLDDPSYLQKASLVDVILDRLLEVGGAAEQDVQYKTLINDAQTQ